MSGSPEVDHATPADVTSWLDLTRELEPLFGPMPAFDSTLQRNIERGSALTVRALDGQVLGGVLFGRDDRHGVIGWLGVRSNARRGGVGKALLSRAISELPAGLDVVVDTFGPDIPNGLAARALYAAAGFHLMEPLPSAADGSSRERWLLRRASPLHERP
jgi:ribosomal protein S18 acetylase RimI-like enzyme